MKVYVETVAEALQVPVDMVGVTVLTVVSLSIQTKFAICPIEGWIEPLNLYAVIAARPSERKSPVVREVTQVIYKYANEYNEKNRQRIEEYNIEKDVLIKKIANMKQELASVKKSKITFTMDDLKALQDEYSELEEVTPLRLVADDVTPEALASLMCENGGKMAIISTEGGMFDIAAGRYSDKANIDVFLKAYSGDPIMVDRKGRTAECIPSPALTILLTVQPTVIEEIMNNKEMSGKGFVARFLYSIPVSRIGNRSYRVKPIPKEVKGKFDNLICRLLDIPDIGSPRNLRLSAEADKLAEGFFQEIESQLLNDLEMIEGWAGKLHGQTMRIAGILHCCEHIEDSCNVPVSGETMKNAISLGRYFLEHAKAAFYIMGFSDPPEVKDAKYLIKKIDNFYSEGDSQNPQNTQNTQNIEKNIEPKIPIIPKIMKLRDLYHSCKGKFRTVDDMQPGLNELIERGFIRIVKRQTGKAGRPSEVIEVNPEYWKSKERAEDEV